MRVNSFEAVSVNRVRLKPSANAFRPQPPSSWPTAFVFRVDYYNSIHGGSTDVSSIGYSQCSTSPPVSLYGRTPSDPTADLLRDNLHWLRVPSGSLISCA